MTAKLPRAFLPTSAALLVALSLSRVGCGGDVQTCSGADCGSSGAVGASTGAAGDAGDAGGGGGDSCHLDAPGTTFVFHVHNAGSKMLGLGYGCGGTLPVVLDTPMGKLAISPGPADYCEISCDSVYKGQANNGCSDCGPGTGDPLPPGATADIKWDRRVFAAFVADPKCSGLQSGNNCALGTAVAAKTGQAGTLTVCSSPSLGPGNGACNGISPFPVPFSVDTTKSEATIDVQ